MKRNEKKPRDIVVQRIHIQTLKSIK